MQETLQHLVAMKRKQQKDGTFNSGKQAMQSVESQNKNGTCDKQLEYRLIQYLKIYKTLPSRSTKGEGGRICKALYRRFGSLNNGFKKYGLPARHRMGTNVEMVAPNNEVFRFNYNKNYNRQETYLWIVKNSEANL